MNRISVVKCNASCRNSITENFAIKECNLTVDVNCYATTFCWKIGQLTLFATFFNQQDIYFTFAAGFWPRIYTMTASIRILTKWSAAMTLMYLTYWKLKSDRMWTTLEQEESSTSQWAAHIVVRTQNWTMFLKCIKMLPKISWGISEL